jgi:hypothetical protein
MSSRYFRGALLIAGLGGLAGLTTDLAAQAPSSAAADSTRWRNVISINPLGIPIEYFSAEWERMTTGYMSVGLAGTYTGPFDVEYLTGDLKVRFYPSERGPAGFSIGMSGGFARLRENLFDSGDQKISRPTLGVIVDYNWVLGRNDRFLVGVGLGAKRVLGDGGGFSGIEVAYPTVRFQFGLRY